MVNTYSVGKGDAHGKASRAQLGGAKLVAKLADCNGLPDINQLFVGQRMLLNKAPRTQEHERAYRRDI